jgi:signal transduction histidine kinase
VTKRLLLGYIAITLAVLAVLAIPFGISNQNQQKKVLKLRLEHDAWVEAAKLADSVRDGTITPSVEAEVRKDMSRTTKDGDCNHGERLVAVDAAVRAMLDTCPPPDKAVDRVFVSRKEFQDAIRGEPNSGSRYSSTLATDLFYAAVPVSAEGTIVGAVRITVTSEFVDAQIYRAWLALGGVAIVSLGAVAGIGVILARSFARPINDLEETATAFGAGQLSRRVSRVRGPSEVRSLAQSFNQTADRLEDLVTSQEQFVADASHQLRTPLTGMRLRLENLESDVRPEAKEDLDGAISEVDRLSRVVDGLLALARADRRDSARTATSQDALALLLDRRTTWQPFADERNVAIQVDCPPGLVVVADPDRVSQVLDNLIANALDAMAAQGQGWIVLGARGGSGEVTLHVIDGGPGLTAEQRARAFDRFWRADPRRRNGFGGSGLGLAIVDKLVQADGGTTRLDEAPGGGVDAVVTMKGGIALPRP